MRQWTLLLPVAAALGPVVGAANATYSLARAPGPQHELDSSARAKLSVAFQNDQDPPEEQPCHAVHRQPAQKEQCEYAQTHCTEYKIGLVNYVSFYYCSSYPSIFKLAGYTVTLVALFTTLGITASEFLCPNLSYIAHFFKMSESLAGVTLLALGNGSPDVFSTYESIKIDSASLAIAELCGAALFITCVVVGCMAIVHPFRVFKKPFLRDVIFLLVSTLVACWIFSDGSVTRAEAALLLVMYAVYVCFVVFWDWLLVKNRRLELLDQKIRNLYASEDVSEFVVQENSEVNDEDILGPLSSSRGAGSLQDEDSDTDNENIQRWASESLSQFYRPSIVGAIELNSRLSSLYRQEGQIRLDSAASDAISLHTVSHGAGDPLAHAAPPGAGPAGYTEPAAGATHTIRMSHAPAYRDDERLGVAQAQAPAYRDDEGLGLVAQAEFYADQADYADALSALRQLVSDDTRSSSRNVLLAVFPTMRGFRSQSPLGRAFNIVCLPMVTLLRLTVPVVERGTDTIAEQHHLFVAQSLVAPWVLGGLVLDQAGLAVRLLVSLAATGLWLGLLVAYKSRAGEIPQLASLIRLVYAFVGFLASIVWISTIATELIAIIKFYAILLDLSDAILGLTVFAIGNSLGDLISNFTIAKMGFPMMALSACFGGPLLNILLGVGGGGLFVASAPATQVHISSTLVVSVAALLANLVFLLVRVPANGWYLDRATGVVMVALWALATLVCVVFEVV